MGGKTKQAQRTKNNSRPSSSTRSAELLGSVGFTGFTAIENLGLVPVVPGFGTTETISEEVDSNLDNNFQLVLKKLTKKDPVTKVKGLQEFSELIANAEVEVVKSVLPFWPRIFVNLTTDTDHRVRETAQIAQSAVVLKAGKNIAPYLRQLAPAWICSQYDTYAPVASIASSSFKRAFPPFKLKDVFVFCENEIVDYLTKNITVHSASTLSNPKSHTPEECEAKYERVIISSLRGYAMYIEKITPEQLNQSVAKNSILIDNPKFWTYYKHKNPAIRSAWFELATALLEHAPFLLEKHAEKLTTQAFLYIDEAETIVLPNVWALIVLIQTKFENWWQYLNMEKAVLPKLWKIVKSGGNGNASIIFPHFLPLISKFDSQTLGCEGNDNSKLIKFYETFFENLNTGLKTIQSSRADIKDISTAYYEVLKYVIIQIQDKTVLKDAEEQRKLCIKLFDDHLIAVINWCMTVEFSCGKYLFSNITALLNYFCLHSGESNLYSELLKHFWSELFQVIRSTTYLPNTATAAEKITKSHIELIQNLKYSYLIKTKQSKVKFSTEDEVDSAGSNMKNMDKLINFEPELNNLVYKLCDMYIDQTNKTNNVIYITNLETLIKDFESFELFQYLSTSTGGENIHSLFNVFSKWLYNSALQSEAIIEILLILYKYLDNDGKIELLLKIIKVPLQSVQNWIILRALSHPLCSEPDITKLLSQPEVTDHLINCAKSVTKGVSKDNLVLLHKCFFQTENGDILIDSATCSEIVTIMCKSLSDDSYNSLDSCASFLAQIMPVICGDDNMKTLQQQMFLTLFEFSVCKIISDDLSEDTLWEVTTSWQDSLSSNDLLLDEKLMLTCADIVNKKISLEANQELQISNLESLSDIITKLILCSTECISDEREKLEKIEKIIDSILNHNSKTMKEISNALAHFCKFIDLLNGTITTRTIDSVDNASLLTDENIVNYLIISILKLNIIFKMSCSMKKDKKVSASIKESEAGDDDVDEEYTEDYCDVDEGLIKLWSDEIYEQVLDVIYVSTIGDIILYNLSNVNSYIQTLILYLDEKLILLLKNIPQNYTDKLKEKLFVVSNTQGFIWSKSVLLFLNHEQYADAATGAVLLYEDCTLSTSKDENIMGYINNVQYLSRKMKTNCLPIMPNLFENYFDLLIKMSATRCLILNHFNTNFNNLCDRKIIGNALIILHEINTRNKNEPFLLYNRDLSDCESGTVLLATEVANLLMNVIKYFPTELDTTRWDLLRIALSSWTLSAFKSCHNYKQEKISIFISAIYKLCTELSNFIKEEKIKSSTEHLSKMIEEWENVFEKDVNLVMLKIFINIVNNFDGENRKSIYFIDTISYHIDSLDLSFVIKTNKIDSKISLPDLFAFALKNISHKLHSIRTASTKIIHKLTNGLIEQDLELLNKRNEQSERSNRHNDDENETWHLLAKFNATLVELHNRLEMYIKDFSLKLTEMENSTPIPVDVAIPYLLLWDCILNICANSTSELRSIYARWITKNEYEQILMPTLFKLMPYEILKNPDSGFVYGQTLFANLEWKNIKESKLTPERFGCHLYAQTLRHLPAVVRKWWHGLNPRQAPIVDKITTNFVTGYVCKEEFNSLVEKRDKQDNIQIKVHTALREVTAVYSIDEAKMELIITLPPNHPLGPVKVESGKQIGGRLQSRQVVMQLSIFLTHQNGSIWDGLSLWKKDLDRKFEGVEECYVCYSVIHQDTCQLPRLSCKTCKKKFHGPCLYRWFSTSNKSTCPICRNIF